MSGITEDRATAGEVTLVALALALLAGVVLVLTDAFVLVGRPFWVDEIIAVMIANRPSPATVIADLGHGADGGASLFHLGLWALRVVTGALTPAVLRVISLALVLAALVTSYTVLRRAFAPLPAIAGVLAIGAHALVIEHSYEARFYAPWLLSCALLAWLFAMRQASATRANGVATGVVAFGMCTIHFYGVVTLALMSAAAIAAHGRAWRAGLRVVAPAGTGVLAMLIVIPLAVAQRVAYTVPSWLPDFRPGQLGALLSGFWLESIPLFGAVAIVAATMVRRARGDAMLERLVRTGAANAGIAALFTLAVMPVALAALSIVGQPSMLPRYAIPATLAWGPWTALAVALAGRWGAGLALPMLVWSWVVGYTREARARDDFVNAVGAASQAYQRALSGGQGMPVVFTSMNVMYPVVLASGGAARARYLELPDSTFHALFPDSTPAGQANRVTVLERDLARVHARRLGFPRTISQPEADSLDRFLLLLPAGRVPAGFGSIEAFAKSLFPGHRVSRLLPDLSLVERVPAIGSR